MNKKQLQSKRRKVYQRIAVLLLAVASRKKVVTIYCDKCEKGFDIFRQTLDIHHINDNGGVERKKYNGSTPEYYWALADRFCRDWMDEERNYEQYSLLCRECHKETHEAN